MDGPQQIYIVSKEGDKVEFDARLKDFSQFLLGAPVDEDNTYNTQGKCTKDSLELLKKFCEVHKYDLDKVTWKWPFESAKLDAHIDPTSYSIFKDFEQYGQSPDTIKELAEKLNPILETAFFLDINAFKKVANVTLQIPFFCEPSEDGIKQYKEKWGIKEEDLTPEKQREIIDEHKPIFDKIKEKYLAELDKLQKEAEEQEKKQE